jgi:hypothetical protein
MRGGSLKSYYDSDAYKIAHAYEYGDGTNENGTEITNSDNAKALKYYVKAYDEHLRDEPDNEDPDHEYDPAFKKVSKMMELETPEEWHERMDSGPYLTPYEIEVGQNREREVREVRKQMEARKKRDLEDDLNFETTVQLDYIPDLFNLMFPEDKDPLDQFKKFYNCLDKIKNYVPSHRYTPDYNTYKSYIVKFNLHNEKRLPFSYITKYAEDMIHEKLYENPFYPRYLTTRESYFQIALEMMNIVFQTNKIKYKTFKEKMFKIVECMQKMQGGRKMRKRSSARRSSARRSSARRTTRRSTKRKCTKTRKSRK